MSILHFLGHAFSRMCVWRPISQTKCSQKESQMSHLGKIISRNTCKMVPFRAILVYVWVIITCYVSGKSCKLGYQNESYGTHCRNISRCYNVRLKSTSNTVISMKVWGNLIGNGFIWENGLIDMYTVNQLYLACD